jgi:hypothetical protein
VLWDGKRKRKGGCSENSDNLHVKVNEWLIYSAKSNLLFPPHKWGGAITLNGFTTDVIDERRKVEFHENNGHF